MGTGLAAGMPTVVGPSECESAGFLAPTEGLSGDALWQALTSLSAAHRCDDYTKATTFLFTRMDKIDGEVECVYTGRKTPVTSQKPAEDDMNTEHSWPQSLGAGTEPARCDLHHLYPADSDANAERDNFPFGVVVSGQSFESGGSKLGLDSAGATVFEPRDVHKGNVARSMVYFAFRYGYTLSAAELSLYKAWDSLDPVDSRELERTWTIASEQEIPNPLVVCPGQLQRL